jgi:ribonuclease D
VAGVVPHGLIERADQVVALATRLSSAELIALDVESNGLHAYKPILCTMQLALVHDGEVSEIAIVDTIALGDAALAPLRAPLGAGGPPKVLHDLAFDARILAAHGLMLGNVRDTAIAVRFLGEPATGLSSVAEARLGVKLSKELQHHDWAKRPLTPDWIHYLVTDVVHLPSLALSITADADARDITPEVQAETEYRLLTALASVDEIDPRPPYVRIKGATQLEPMALAVLRAVAEVREEAAQRWNVPPFKVAPNDALIELSKKRPSDPADVRRVRGLDRGRAVSLVASFRRAIADAVTVGDIPESERAQFFAEPTRLPRAFIEARRGREQRLTAWRKKIAKERVVDEQVVLPGHCLQDIVDVQPSDLTELAEIPGIGVRRVERDGEAILAAMQPPPEPLD